MQTYNDKSFNFVIVSLMCITDISYLQNLSLFLKTE